jgi:hypothetical protein
MRDLLGVGLGSFGSAVFLRSQGKEMFGTAAFAGHHHFIAVHDAYSWTFDRGQSEMLF